MSIDHREGNRQQTAAESTTLVPKSVTLQPRYPTLLLTIACGQEGRWNGKGGK